MEFEVAWVLDFMESVSMGVIAICLAWLLVGIAIAAYKKARAGL